MVLSNEGKPTDAATHKITCKLQPCNLHKVQVKDASCSLTCIYISYCLHRFSFLNTNQIDLFYNSQNPLFFPLRFASAYNLTNALSLDDVNSVYNVHVH